MEKRNLFLVFEGLSGAGKTTIAKLVAKKIGAKFYKTPPKIFRSIRNQIDKTASPVARYMFYLAGNFMASQEIGEILKTQPVVSDRYILTTVCYHRAIGVLAEISEVGGLVLPNVNFLVTCKQDIRLARLRARGMTGNDIHEQEPGVEERFIIEYRGFHPIEIDNSADDPKSAVQQVIVYLSSMSLELSKRI